MVNVAIAGAAGRMGQMLIASANEMEDVQLTGAFEHPKSSHLGKDSGIVAGLEATSVPIDGDAQIAIKKAPCVVIDFTVPEATLALLQVCQNAGTPLVIGTTGFTAEQKSTITQGATKIPIVMAPNMSVGVNTLFKLVEMAAKILGDDYDKEIWEAHHRFKKDAPSGTAVKLAEILAETTGRTYPQDICFSREGIIGERTRKEIGMQVMRGGDIVGEHIVYYCGMGERLELKHVATSRKTFADGAVRAAKWLSGKKPGLYDMFDVLGIS